MGRSATTRPAPDDSWMSRWRCSWGREDSDAAFSLNETNIYECSSYVCTEYGQRPSVRARREETSGLGIFLDHSTSSWRRNRREDVEWPNDAQGSLPEFGASSTFEKCCLRRPCRRWAGQYNDFRLLTFAGREPYRTGFYGRRPRLLPTSYADMF